MAWMWVFLDYYYVILELSDSFQSTIYIFFYIYVVLLSLGDNVNSDNYRYQVVQQKIRSAEYYYCFVMFFTINV